MKWLRNSIVTMRYFWSVPAMADSPILGRRWSCCGACTFFSGEVQKTLIVWLNVNMQGLAAAGRDAG